MASNGTGAAPFSLDTPIPGTGLNALDTVCVLNIAGYLSVACLAWLVYDTLAYLREEIVFVWISRWSTTKAFYLLNRIIAPASIIAHIIMLLFNDRLDSESCGGIGRVIEVLQFILTFIQGSVLTMRVWYIWSHRRVVQLLVLIGFVATVLTCTMLTVFSTGDALVTETKDELRSLMHEIGRSDPLYPAIHTIYCLQGSTNSGSVSHEWRLDLILLIMQTFLFVLTILRAISPSKRSMHPTPVVTRLVRDGTVFFVVAFVCLVVDMAISAVDNPKIALPLYFTNLVGVALSVCVAHLILSIRSLAARLSNEPDLLFNDAEMTRLQHLHSIREGSRDGEMIIDITPQYDRPSVSNNVDGDGKRDSHLVSFLPVLTSVGAGVMFDTRSPQAPRPFGYRFVEGSS